MKFLLYKSLYDKRSPDNFSFGATLDCVANVVLNNKRSAPGRGGISVACYRAAGFISISLFKDLFDDINSGHGSPPLIKFESSRERFSFI